MFVAQDFRSHIFLRDLALPADGTLYLEIKVSGLDNLKSKAIAKDVKSLDVASS
jgi:hypothetical protein